MICFAAAVGWTFLGLRMPVDIDGSCAQVDDAICCSLRAATAAEKEKGIVSTYIFFHAFVEEEEMKKDQGRSS